MYSLHTRRHPVMKIGRLHELICNISYILYIPILFMYEMRISSSIHLQIIEHLRVLVHLVVFQVSMSINDCGNVYWQHDLSKISRHISMMTSSKLKHFPRSWPFARGIHRSPVNSPQKRPMTRNFDVFFDLRLNKRLSKQSWGWWFDTSLRPLWRHCNENT